MENQSAGYSVDIVLCIDQTLSMVDIIERVKESALAFHDDLLNEIRSLKLRVDSLRVKVIGFRDYACQIDRGDGLSPMVESPFFVLPDQAEGFELFVNELIAVGGGDPPESGYDALALAINSEWDLTAKNSRQVIVLWTDADSHPLRHGSDHPDYPKSMPEDLGELTGLWVGQKSKVGKFSKRFILYAPDVPSWNDIANNWEYVLKYTLNAGEGLKDHDYQTIINKIIGNVI